MTADQIEDLIGLIPAHAPYISRMPRFKEQKKDDTPDEDINIPDEVGIRAKAMNDASFGWMFVKSFLDLGRPIPPMVLDPLLIRPYCYLRYRHYDRNARAALELEFNANRTKRALLQCMLLVQDLAYDAIASALKLHVDTVMMYEALYWNIRDRFDDKAYIAQLIFPDTRKVEFLPTYFMDENPLYIVLRAAFHHGLQVVEEFLGIRNPIVEFNSQEEAKAYEARVLSAGNYMAKIGYLHQNQAYAISSARHVLQSIKIGGEDKLDDDARRGLEGMSMGRSMTETYLEIVRPDLEYELMLQNAPLD